MEAAPTSTYYTTPLHAHGCGGGKTAAASDVTAPTYHITTRATTRLWWWWTCCSGWCDGTRTDGTRTDTNIPNHTTTHTVVVAVLELLKRVM